jgi:methionine-gamma-lyase
MKNKNKKFDTLCIHGGFKPDRNRAHITPIYASSTYTFENTDQAVRAFQGEEEAYIYARWGSPTLSQTEDKIAALEAYQLKNEQGEDLELKALLHSSGMSAITTMFYSNLKSGDVILSHFSLYGGTQELINRVLSEYEITCIHNSLQDLNEVESIFQKNDKIKLLYLETPANPTLQCVDMESLCLLAKKYNVKVAVDNTFATPYLQQPFKYGADFVMHSTTKFLNGHGNAMGGILLGKDLEFMNTKVAKFYKLLGGAANSFEAFLLNGGIKTLPLRMDKHCSNAATIAAFLNSNNQVASVNYLGLDSNPYKKIAEKQMKNPGALLSFELKTGFEGAKKFINQVQLCTHAVSLGTCDTLVNHPASSVHVGVSPEHRLASGITDGLIRMSVGIENIQDLLEDLENAMK